MRPARPAESIPLLVLLKVLPKSVSAASQRRHFFAGFRAGPACVNTFIHISDALAVIRAIGADCGTNPTGFLMQIRVAHEELGAGLANFRAKQHQPKVLGCHVLASHFMTMGSSH
jgi:hypothetical protein